MATSKCSERVPSMVGDEEHTRITFNGDVNTVINIGNHTGSIELSSKPENQRHSQDAATDVIKVEDSYLGWLKNKLIAEQTDVELIRLQGVSDGRRGSQ